MKQHLTLLVFGLIAFAVSFLGGSTDVGVQCAALPLLPLVGLIGLGGTGIAFGTGFAADKIGDAALKATILGGIIAGTVILVDDDARKTVLGLAKSLKG